MASLATSSILPLLILLVAAADAATLTITNKCGYTVWPAAVPPGGGRKLETGETWTVRVPAGTRGGRVWGRTGCGFESNGKLGQCQTGDCGGVLQCKNRGAPPTTLAEFSLNQRNNLDYFDISLLDGFNVPMAILPAGGCPRGGPRCPAEITQQCPGVLRAKAGCNNPCATFQQDKYCCTGTAANNCGPTDYSLFFKRLCPDVITYPKDVRNTTFTCSAGTNYQIVFCP